MATVISMAGNKDKSLEDLLNDLKDGILKTFSSELVFMKIQGADTYRVRIIVFEKYYWRNGSYANLTIIITDSEEEQTAEIIGSGGGEGLVNFSWGANYDFAELAAHVLNQDGFAETERKDNRL
ncbi:MAG: DUF6054 family protein [Eubacteriales bacterium]|nr:DUF6054 family protein [Eubacteriales bacterium]